MSLNENPRVDRPGGLRLAHCDVLHHPLDGLDGGAPHLRSHRRSPFSALQCQSLSDFVYVQWWYNFRFRLLHLPFKSLKFGHNFSQVGIQTAEKKSLSDSTFEGKIHKIHEFQRLPLSMCMYFLQQRQSLRKQQLLAVRLPRMKWRHTGGARRGEEGRGGEGREEDHACVQGERESVQWARERESAKGREGGSQQPVGGVGVGGFREALTPEHKLISSSMQSNGIGYFAMCGSRKRTRIQFKGI